MTASSCVGREDRIRTSVARTQLSIGSCHRLNIQPNSAGKRYWAGFIGTLVERYQALALYNAKHRRAKELKRAHFNFSPTFFLQLIKQMVGRIAHSCLYIDIRSLLSWGSACKMASADDHHADPNQTKASKLFACDGLEHLGRHSEGLEMGLRNEGSF